MYFKIYDFFFEVLHLKPGAEASVFGAILALYSRTSKPTTVPLRIMSQMTGYHRDTVIESIKSLSIQGYVVPITCPGRATKYIVQLPAEMRELLKKEIKRATKRNSADKKQEIMPHYKFEVHGDITDS